MVAAMAQQDARVSLLANSRNVGFAVGCNQGARKGSADTVILINPDTVISPEAIDCLVGVAARSGVGPVGGRSIDATGRADGLSVQNSPTVLGSLVWAFSKPSWAAVFPIGLAQLLDDTSQYCRKRSSRANAECQLLAVVSWPSTADPGNSWVALMRPSSSTVRTSISRCVRLREGCIRCIHPTRCLPMSVGRLRAVRHNEGSSCFRVAPPSCGSTGRPRGLGLVASCSFLALRSGHSRRALGMAKGDGDRRSRNARLGYPATRLPGYPREASRPELTGLSASTCSPL